MKITRVLFLFFVCFWHAAVAFARDPETANLLERLRLLEQQARRLDAVTAELKQLREEVRILKEKLGQYEGPPAVSPPDPMISTKGRSEPAPAPRQDREESLPDSEISQSDNGGGYGKGFDLGFWGWLSYLRTPQNDLNTFVAWEAELDITKTFSDRIAASADIDFIYTPFEEAVEHYLEDEEEAAEYYLEDEEEARVRIEQLFVSVLLSNRHETVFTAGKFNAPFGVEPRDFWDRVSGSTSLLFRAQPQDLTGIMITQPLFDKSVVLRPFVVNGFDNSLDINEQPSLGLMTEYRPHKNLSLAATNWWGPEFRDENGEKLYFLDLQATWLCDLGLTFSGEYLLATGQSPDGDLDWSGWLALVNYDLSERGRVFGRWSLLDDPDGFVTRVAQRVQELSAGVGYYLHPQVELRLEYRHDFSRGAEDLDTWSAHLTFGY